MPVTPRVARAVVLMVAVAATACAGSPHPEVPDDALACAAAWETRGMLAQDGFGDADDPSGRAAGVLREVATGQFVLGALEPQDETLSAAVERVTTATDPGDAASAINAVTERCVEADLPTELDGAEHTTAACRQLVTLSAAAEGSGASEGTGAADDGASQAPSRTAFVVDHLRRSADELEPRLREVVQELDGTSADDEAAVVQALGRADEVCGDLREG